MKKLKWIFLFALVASLGAYGASHWISNAGKSNIAWRTDKITRGDIAQSVSASGTLNPREMVTVSTQASGMVSNIHVKINDTVKKGQLLAEIDPTLLLTQLKQSQSALEMARFSYERASRNLKRTQQLFAKNYVARVEIESAEEAYHGAINGYNSAKTQVERDQANLNYTKIVSPIDGVVSAKQTEVGQTVISSTSPPPLFTIAGDFKNMKIDVRFSEADIAQVKNGMKVNFNVDAFQGRAFAGKIESINLSPVTEGNSVNYTAVIAVDNPDRSLLPGMTAYLNVLLFEKKDVLRIPAAALRFTPPVATENNGLKDLLQMGVASSANADSQTGNTQTIHVLRSGNIVPVEVTIGAMDDTHVEISGEGFKEGDQVVTGMQPLSR